MNFDEPNGEAVGLCAVCRHHRAVRSSRGPAYHRCVLAESDPDFDKYPRLPVLECRGFERTEGASGPV